jgi:hypothetical protein
MRKKNHPHKDQVQRLIPIRYLDTGATNHMTGRGNVFSELDRVVQGTVKFRDGSIINICGKGTIIFSGRHGEHKVLTGVY